LACAKNKRLKRDGSQQSFQVRGRKVDDEALDLAATHRLKFFGHHLDVPVELQGLTRLDLRERAIHECTEVGAKISA